MDDFSSLGRAERKELARWASLVKEPDCRVDFSPLGEGRVAKELAQWASLAKGLDCRADFSLLGRAEFKELAQWASLAKEPDCRADFSPLGEIRKGVSY